MGAAVAGGDTGVGGLAQRGVHGHHLGDRAEDGQAGHRVGGRSAGDPALGFGFAAAFGVPDRVELVGDLLDFVGEPFVTPPVQHGGVGAQLGVDQLPVLAGQEQGLPGEQGGPPLRDDPSLQGGQGVRHLAGQDLGQAQVPPTLVRGFLAGQRDLPGDPAALAFGGDPTGGVRGPHRFVEVDGDPGLGGRGGGFQLFEGAELVDPFGVGDIPLEGGELVDPAGDNDGIYCRTQFVVAGRTSLGIRRWGCGVWVGWRGLRHVLEFSRRDVRCAGLFG